MFLGWGSARPPSGAWLGGISPVLIYPQSHQLALGAGQLPPASAKPTQQCPGYHNLGNGGEKGVTKGLGELGG